MAIYFRYNFDSLLLMIGSSFMILGFIMLFLASRVQEKDYKKPYLLKYAGIIGIIVVSISATLPTIVCTPPISGLCYILGFFRALIFYIPLLVSLGILLFLFGKENRETYSNFLYYSGICWIVTFFGFFFGLLVISFGLWMLLFIGMISYLAIPAFILMIIHGAKFKDNFFVLSGLLFILSWLSSIILTMFISF
ncbi:MAG: hypothetical protein ACFFCV_03550 [Promethearchaeota archaeon]